MAPGLSAKAFNRRNWLAASSASALKGIEKYTWRHNAERVFDAAHNL